MHFRLMFSLLIGFLNFYKGFFFAFIFNDYCFYLFTHVTRVYDCLLDSWILMWFSRKIFLFMRFFFYIIINHCFNLFSQVTRVSDSIKFFCWQICRTSVGGKKRLDSWMTRIWMNKWFFDMLLSVMWLLKFFLMVLYILNYCKMLFTYITRVFYSLKKKFNFLRTSSWLNWVHAFLFNSRFSVTKFVLTLGGEDFLFKFKFKAWGRVLLYIFKFRSFLKIDRGIFFLLKLKFRSFLWT